MKAIYNEIEPFAAEWMRNLIASGHIAPGVVNERSIKDLSASDVAGPGQRHFFAGIGVWSYALRLAGVRDDASVWTGSCPCQPFSSAGRGAGFSDERHLWPTWFALIRECRPAIVFGEQVASPDGLKWLDLVSADLEGAGYAFGAADLCAAGIGAPHIRQRLYFVAHAGGERCDRIDSLVSGRGPHKAGSEASGRGSSVGTWSSPREAGDLGALRVGHSGVDRDRQHPRELHRDEAQLAVGAENSNHAPVDSGDARHATWENVEWVPCRDGKTRPVEPGIEPLAHGAPARVGRLRAYGNAIVPQVAATFIRAALGAP